MTALLAPAPAAVPPRVGIVPVRLPGDDYEMRSVWLDTDTLLVGFDPARLTRDLVELLLTEQLGDWVDVDREEATR